jgi:EVE domain
MDYYLDLFTPETWEAFKAHGAKVSGFRERQRKTADRIKPGDKFVCYLVRLSRWCGILEVTSKVFIDNDPIFTNPDPFIVRFEVRPIVVLDIEKSIPILDEAVWSKLSMTKSIERGRQSWAQIANVRASLRQIGSEDGQYLARLLGDQNLKQKTFPLSQIDKQRMGQTAQTTTGAVLVTVPSEDVDNEPLDTTAHPDIRDSIRVQPCWPGSAQRWAFGFGCRVRISSE